MASAGVAAALEPPLPALVEAVQQVVHDELEVFGEMLRRSLRGEIEAWINLGVAVPQTGRTAVGGVAWKKERRSEPPGRSSCGIQHFTPLRSFATSRYAKILSEGECSADDLAGHLPAALRTREHSVRTSNSSQRSSLASSRSTITRVASLSPRRPGGGPGPGGGGGGGRAAAAGSTSVRSALRSSNAPPPESSPWPGAGDAAQRVLAEALALSKEREALEAGGGAPPRRGSDGSEDSGHPFAVRPNRVQISAAPPAELGPLPAKVVRVSSGPRVMHQASILASDSVVTLPSRTRQSISHTTRALSLLPVRTVRFSFFDRTDYRRVLADRLLRSGRFEFLVFFMIVASAVLVGVETMLLSQAAGHETDTPLVLRLADGGVCLFFLFDLMLRIYVQRSAFLKVWGWGYNVFDSVLVASQVLEQVLQFYTGSTAVSAGLNGLKSSFVFRLLRMLRAFRAVRVLYVIRFTEELRMLVGCVVFSMRHFFWACVLLSLIIYIASVSLSQLVAVHRFDLEPGMTAAPALLQWFGSLPKAALSIFQGLTGGVDWYELVDPLMVHISPAAGFIFVIFMAFALLAVMNVVMATFVEGVIQRATQIKDIQKIRDASRLFKHIDCDQNGYISFDQIDDQLESPEVQAFLHSIDVDPDHARVFLGLLDADGSGVIEFREFLSGCIRLQGPAKAADLVMFVREIRSIVEALAARLATARDPGPSSGFLCETFD